MLVRERQPLLEGYLEQILGARSVQYLYFFQKSPDAFLQLQYIVILTTAVTSHQYLLVVLKLLPKYLAGLYHIALDAIRLCRF